MTLRTSDLGSAGLSNAPMTEHARPTSDRPARRTRLIACAVVGVVGIGVLGFAVRGSGAKSKIYHLLGWEKPRPAAAVQMPFVRENDMVPLDCSTGIDPTAPILLPLTLPNGPVDATTLNDDSASIYRFDNRQRVPAKVTLKNDAILVTPTAPLESNRNYRVQLLPGVKDVKGNAVRQKSLAFFTSAQPPAGVAFDKVRLETTVGENFTCVEFGPEGKLYASTHDGRIMRFQVLPDGTLGTPEVFATLPQQSGGPRLVTGFTFDPHSNPLEPMIYLTSSEFGFMDVADFSGRLHRLSGPGFTKLETLVTNLPRSARDHATNQPHFGPDGMLYIPQPSNTAVGGADEFWFFREEHGLNSTILRIDTSKLVAGQTIDAKTRDAGGSFDPDAPGSAMTVYTRGLRMPYDLLWHSNGSLYTAVNGASSGGATPAGPGVAAISKVTLAEHDWLFRLTPNQYYGHPNPTQGFYVLNGGNPTAGPDFNEVSDYPVGTQPDSRWTPAIYDFGMHVSADGMIEYRSSAFGGALKGKIFVCRFNKDQDLILLGLDAQGNVNYAATGIPGTTQLEQPLDLTEDPRTGNLYVCEYGGLPQPRMTLLRVRK